jgi:hypothetical protein
MYSLDHDKNWIVREYVIKDVRLETIISHINRMSNQTRFFWLDKAI